VGRRGGRRTLEEHYLNLVDVPEPTVTLAALASRDLAGLVLRRRSTA
jgi:hypothetical protein